MVKEKFEVNPKGRKSYAEMWRGKKNRHFPTDLLNVRKTLEASSKIVIERILGQELRDFKIVFPPTRTVDDPPAAIDRHSQTVYIYDAVDVFEKYLEKSVDKEHELMLRDTALNKDPFSELSKTQKKIRDRQKYDIGGIENEDVDFIAGLLGHELGHLIHKSAILTRVPFEELPKGEQKMLAHGKYSKDTKFISSMEILQKYVAEIKADKDERYESIKKATDFNDWKRKSYAKDTSTSLETEHHAKTLKHHLVDVKDKFPKVADAFHPKIALESWARRVADKIVKPVYMQGSSKTRNTDTGFDSDYIMADLDSFKPNLNSATTPAGLDGYLEHDIFPVRRNELTEQHAPTLGWELDLRQASLSEVLPKTKPLMTTPYVWNKPVMLENQLGYGTVFQGSEYEDLLEQPFDINSSIGRNNAQDPDNLELEVGQDFDHRMMWRDKDGNIELRYSHMPVFEHTDEHHNDPRWTSMRRSFEDLRDEQYRKEITAHNMKEGWEFDEFGNPDKSLKTDKFLQSDAYFGEFMPFTSGGTKTAPSNFFSKQEYLDALANAIDERLTNLSTNVYKNATPKQRRGFIEALTSSGVTDHYREITLGGGSNYGGDNHYLSNDFILGKQDSSNPNYVTESGYLNIATNYQNHIVDPYRTMKGYGGNLTYDADDFFNDKFNYIEMDDRKRKQFIRDNLETVMDSPFGGFMGARATGKRTDIPDLWALLEQNHNVPPAYQRIYPEYQNNIKNKIPDVHKKPMDDRDLLAYRLNPSTAETGKGARKLNRIIGDNAQSIDTLLSEATADAVAYERIVPILSKPVTQVRDKYFDDTRSATLNNWAGADKNDMKSLQALTYAYGMARVYKFEDDLPVKTELQKTVIDVLKPYFDNVQREPKKGEFTGKGNKYRYTPKSPRHRDTSPDLSVKASLELYLNVPEGFQLGEAPDPPTGGQPPPVPPVNPPTEPPKDPPKKDIEVGDKVKIKATGQTAVVTGITEVLGGKSYELQPIMDLSDAQAFVSQLRTIDGGNVVAGRDEFTPFDEDDGTGGGGGGEGEGEGEGQGGGGDGEGGDEDDQGTDRRGIREDGEPTDEEGEGEGQGGGGQITKRRPEIEPTGNEGTTPVWGEGKPPEDAPEWDGELPEGDPPERIPNIKEVLEELEKKAIEDGVDARTDEEISGADSMLDLDEKRKRVHEAHSPKQGGGVGGTMVKDGDENFKDFDDEELASLMEDLNKQMDKVEEDVKQGTEATDQSAFDDIINDPEISDNVKENIKRGNYTRGIKTSTRTKQGLTFAEKAQEDPTFRNLSDHFKKLLDPTVYTEDSVAGRIRGDIVFKEQARQTWIPEKAQQSREKFETGSLIVVLDKSGSMRNTGSNIPAGITALALMDGARKAGMDTALYTYGHHYAVREMDKQSRNLHLDPTADGQSTPSGEAIASVYGAEKRKNGLLDKRKYKRRSIIHITDGAPDGSGAPIVRAFNKKMNAENIHTSAIGLGLVGGALKRMYAPSAITLVKDNKKIAQAVKKTVGRIASSKPPRIPSRATSTAGTRSYFQGFSDSPKLKLTQNKLDLDGTRSPTQRKLNRATKV